MEAIALSIVTFFSTALGGLLALRLRSELSRLIAFGAGAVVGVALLDVLPEALEQGRAAHLADYDVLLAAAGGFLLFHALSRAALLGAPHHHGGEAHGKLVAGTHPAPLSGTVAAAGLSVHSLLDGVAIGVAFHAGTGVGIAVALAVIAHDAADGLNTVTVILSHGHATRRSLIWLAIDALAPVTGALIALAAPLPGGALAPLLGGFVGFFLYVGAADMLPEAQRHDQTPWPTALLAAGLAFAALVARVATSG